MRFPETTLAQRLSKHQFAFGTVVSTLVLGLLGYGLMLYQGSSVGFQKRKGTLEEIREQPIPAQINARLSDVDLKASTGLKVMARLRQPKVMRSTLPAIIILGARKLGRKHVNLAPMQEQFQKVILVSMEYPEPLRSRPSKNILAVRGAAFEAVASVMLVVDYLEARQEVDKQRIMLIGGSIGAPVAIIAGAIDKRIQAVAAGYSGGRQGQLFSHMIASSLPRSWINVTLSIVAGHILAWALTPLDSIRYVPMISPRPLLLINGDQDEMIPRESAEALYAAAREPKEQIWLSSRHIGTREEDLIREALHLTVQWLERKGLL